MSMSAWNELMDDDPPTPSSEKRSESLPHRMQQIEAFIGDSSEEPFDDFRKTPTVSFPSPTHRRSRSLNSKDHKENENSFDNSFVHIRPKDLLPSELNNLIDPPECVPNLEVFEGILCSDNKEKLTIAMKVLNRFLKTKPDAKEQSKILRSAAEICKKFCFFIDALTLYSRAIDTEPGNPQNYLDYSKVLEEFGESESAEEILKSGLSNSTAHDQITPKLVKMYERRQRFSSIRKVIGGIFITYGFNGSISALLEGILFEVRHGDVRKVLGVLTDIENHTQLKNSFYVDLSEELRRRGLIKQAMHYARIGIEKYSIMPSNWTQYIIIQQNSKDTLDALNAASQKLSQSSMAKIIQISAMQIARLGDIQTARRIITEALVSAPNDQRWRYLYNIGIIEALFGNQKVVEKLLRYSVSMTPAKSASAVLMGLAKAFEEEGNIKKAREVYMTLKKKHSSDWRIYLENALFLVRIGKRSKALSAVKEALEIHEHTGRLWALLIQLEDESKQIEALRQAAEKAPKSGEVWVEAARIAMNPLLPYFNLKSASFYLAESFLFTPQYVDIFVEMVRLEYLQNGLGADIRNIRDLFLSGEGNYGTVVYMFRRPGFEFTKAEFDAIAEGVRLDIVNHQNLYARAIARSSFVVESVRNESARLEKSRENVNPFTFSFGLSSFFDAVSASKANGSSAELLDMRKAIIFGSSNVLL